MRALGVVGLSLVIALGVGCESDGDDAAGGGSVKSPLGRPGDEATWSYESTSANGVKAAIEGLRLPPRVVNGVSYDVVHVGKRDEASPDGPEVWFDWRPDDEQIVLAGGAIYWADSGLVPAGEPLISGTLDEPGVMDLAPPVGVQQTISGSGTVAVGDPDDPDATQEVEGTFTYTLVDDAAVIETQLGPLSGCRKFEGTVDAGGSEYSGVGWYRDDLGLVYVEVGYPPPDGMVLDLAGITDPGSATGGSNTIQAFDVVTPEDPSFYLDTYDVNQAFDADKNKHAKMLLELRWADETKARTADPPTSISPDFGTVWGTYPSMLIASDLSIFHPEENGEGFRYAVSFVDQAAKNEAENGIAYHIGVTLPDYITSPVRVTARIYYHRWTP